MSTPTTALRVISPGLTSREEAAAHAALRPTRLEDFVGLADRVERLRIALESASVRREPLDHVLLHGPPGTGKTTLANLIGEGHRVVAVPAPSLRSAMDLIGVLYGLGHGDVLFVDEIHRLKIATEEFLYSAMEDFSLDATEGKGADARAVRIPLKHFTLIGATTQLGRLSAPLRDRFGLQFGLDLYPATDLAGIVQRSARLLDMRLEPAAAFDIACRSRGTPRIANRLLKRVRDYQVVRGGGLGRAVSPDVSSAALDLEGLDADGLCDMDRRYLDALVTYYGGEAGLTALAATLQTDPRTISEAIEPFLLYRGYIIRTPTGRQATDKARTRLARGG